jgi:hypothetical protein
MPDAAADIDAERSKVLALRLALMRGGYLPIPLFGKAPPVYGKNNSKKGLGNWQKLENISYEQIKMWGRTWPDAVNTGVLTRLTPALDLDLLNEAAAVAAEGYVRERFEERGYILSRIGRAPKRAILFRTDEPFTKIVASLVAPDGSAEKIEFLADGQQVVVDGIHPDTQRPYGWQGGSPGVIAREDLPYISDAEARALVGELVDLLVRDFGYRGKQERETPTPRVSIVWSPGVEDWSHLTANILAGRELHDSLRDLAAKMVKSGTNDGAVVNHLRGLMDASTAPRDDRWQERWDNIPRLVTSAGKYRQPSDETSEPAPPQPEPPRDKKKPDGSDIYGVDTLRTEIFPILKQIAGDILVEGLTLLASRPKIGKTWLALDLAIAVDQARYCLGDIRCEQGDVLFLALEDNKRRMQRRLTKLLGIHKTEWPRFSCAHKWPRANEGGLERIRDWIEQHKDTARLVVIDVLVRFRKLAPPGKQSYDLDYEAIAELQKIASDTGVAILVIHHTRKGEADDPLDAVSGTLGLAGAADAVLVIDRKSDGVRLYGRGRDVDEIDKAMLFDKATCRWTIIGETADVRRSKERQEILDVLVEPTKLKDIAAVIGKPVKTVFRLLEKMAAKGEITRPSRGVYAPAAKGENGNQWWQR